MEFGAEFVERSGIGCLFKEQSTELSLSRLNGSRENLMVIHWRIMRLILAKRNAKKIKIRDIFKREITGKKNIIKLEY